MQAAESSRHLPFSMIFYIFDYMSQIVKPSSPSVATPAGEKVTAILRVARERLARYGFSHVTMDEIARDIGMVKGAVYYYFPTKEKIFEAVIQEEQVSFIEKIEKLLGEAVPAHDKLTRYVRERHLYIQHLLGLGQLDYDAWRKLKPHFHDLFQQFDRKECQLVRRILDEGVRSSELALHDAGAHARLFIRAIKGLTLLSGLYGNPQGREPADLDQEIRLFTALFLSGIQNNKRRQ